MARYAQSVGVPSTAYQRALTFADAQRPVERDGVGGGALLVLRRHHPHLAERRHRLDQGLEPLGVDAVVVGDEDADGQLRPRTIALRPA